MKLRFVHGLQRVLLATSYWLHRFFSRGSRGSITWVVGPDEVAGMVRNVSLSLPGSYSVSFSKNRFYDFTYDYSPPSGKARWLGRSLVGPFLLGRLATRTRGVFYLGATGFLIDGVDRRGFEFSFLKKHGIKVVCFFVGNDIRSVKLMLELEGRMKLPNLGTYLAQVNPVFRTDEYDDAKRAIARVADRHADLIFNAAVDQLSYLEKPTRPFLYFLPDEAFTHAKGKFAGIERLIVVHAPSSPIIKGTQLVRAAVAQLHSEGYEFDYFELIDTPNEVVLRRLKRAHIVLNEFYSFVPGMFGVEAMAARCALLTAADERIETGLPVGSNSAWLVTKHFQIYENLKRLLDYPESIEPLAIAGERWARRNAACTQSGEKLRTALEEVAKVDAPFH